MDAVGCQTVIWECTLGKKYPVLLQYCTFSAKPVSLLSTEQPQNLENKFPDQLSSENWWSRVRPLQRCELQQGRLRVEIRKNFLLRGLSSTGTDFSGKWWSHHPWGCPRSDWMWHSVQWFSWDSVKVWNPWSWSFIMINPWSLLASVIL